MAGGAGRVSLPVHILILDSLPPQEGGNGYFFVFVFVCRLRTAKTWIVVARGNESNRKPFLQAQEMWS